MPNQEQEQPDARKLAMAKRCCLLTGSYDGNQTACPCECKDECWFTIEERTELEQLPEVQEAKARKLEHFKSLGPRRAED